jgi:hypothetical protein
LYKVSHHGDSSWWGELAECISQWARDWATGNVADGPPKAQSNDTHPTFIYFLLVKLDLNMAQKAITGAQVLPRFLLPQLSWQGRATTIQLPVRSTSLFAAYSTDSYGQNRRNTPITARRSMFQRKDGAAITQKLPMRRDFSSSPMRPRDYHFDTLKFVKRLKDEGFTETQSVAMMKVLSDVIEER